MALSKPDADNVRHGVVDDAHAHAVVKLLESLVETPAEGVAVLVLTLKLMCEANNLPVDVALKEIGMVYRSLERVGGTQ
jgi:hypothetical protein